MQGEIENRFFIVATARIAVSAKYPLESAGVSMGISSTGLSDIEKGRSTRRKRLAQEPAVGLPLLTRQQLVSFLNANGIPISESVLAKLSSPKVGKGPPIHSWWGKRPLHAPGPALEWAKSLLRDRPTDLAARDGAA
jgi:hypothetical protein